MRISVTRQSNGRFYWVVLAGSSFMNAGWENTRTKAREAAEASVKAMVR